MSANIDVLDPKLRKAAQEVARGLADKRAQAVLLVGSFQRGDAHVESDVDLIVIGRGPGYRLERHAQYLFSISWRTLMQMRRVLDTPAEAAGAVLGWRQALVLHDPHGVGRSMRAEAKAWTWARVQKKCDSWVAEQITGYAEDIQKLLGSLQLKRPLVAAAYRCVLAFYLNEIMAVHHRILYDGDHDLFEKVGEAMGARWRVLQATASGVTSGTLEQSAHAAMEMYSLAASRVRHLLDERQSAIAAHACEVAGFPLQTPRR